MLTKSGYSKLLNRIWETGGLTADMEEDLRRLQDDFDEREGMLRKYGEVYDGEDRDEYEYVENKPDDTDWKGKYEEMRTRYRDRFIYGERTRANGDADDRKTIMDSQEADIKRDGTPQTWDDLIATAYQQKDDKEVNG